MTVVFFVLNERAVKRSCNTWNQSCIEVALSSPQLFSAVKAEYEFLQKNEVWELVEMPDETNFVTSKWHFALKKNTKGEIIRLNASQVARRFKQKQGVDYNQTYS